MKVRILGGENRAVHCGTSQSARERVPGYIHRCISISHMVLRAGYRADRGHLSQREGQAQGAREGEEHAIDQRRGTAVLEAELEADGHALPGREEGDGHAEDREGGEVSLQTDCQLCSIQYRAES